MAQGGQDWIRAAGARTATIKPGSPRKNGYVESFNARLRDELPEGEIVHSLREAEIVIESWRRHTSTIRPHISLGPKPPAPEALIPALPAWPAARHQRAPPARLTLAPRPQPNTTFPWATQWGQAALQPGRRSR